MLSNTMQGQERAEREGNNVKVTAGGPRPLGLVTNIVRKSNVTWFVYAC